MLGVMGFAEMRARRMIPYESDEGIKFAEYLMRLVSTAAWDESRALAMARGQFPNIKGSALDRPVIVPVHRVAIRVTEQRLDGDHGPAAVEIGHGGQRGETAFGVRFPRRPDQPIRG